MEIRQSGLTAIDLFSGAGGLSLGAARAGVAVVAAAELDADAVATYRNLHSTNVEVFAGDINEMSFERYRGEVDMVIGGPPCQPFSHGGLRLGAADLRNGLPAFVRAVESIRPRYFVMENVPGLASGAAAAVLRATMKQLASLDYEVDSKVLKAADFGVAQRRQRLFVIGSQDGSARWPLPTHGSTASQPWITSREVLRAVGDAGEANPSIVTYAKSPDLRPSPWDGHLFNGGGRPINPAGLAPTLLASMGGNKTPWVDSQDLVPDYHAHLRRGGAPRAGVVSGARRITIREAAALQGFPSDTRWSGGRSSQYRQIGNAVPVPLASNVVRAVAGRTA